MVDGVSEYNLCKLYCVNRLCNLHGSFSRCFSDWICSLKYFSRWIAVMISRDCTQMSLFHTNSEFCCYVQKGRGRKGQHFLASKKSPMKETPKLIISLKRKCSLKRAGSHYNMTQIIFTLVSARSRRHKSDLKHFLSVPSNA